MKKHFEPSKGWMNDPNGTIVIDGTYHLFYQYYPDDIKWGPMRWGHAVSKDGITWEHRKIALFPDSLGYIFSGSCVLDTENASGLGDGSTPPLIAIYTSHNPETLEQQQCIAFSLDYETFTPYAGNPVITNAKTKPGFKIDFRDPKVFKNPVTGGFSMALAVGPTIEFYHSLNLTDWEKTGTFDIESVGLKGICECQMIGWGECWSYAQDTPASTRRGKMTSIKNVSLAETNKFHDCFDDSVYSVFTAKRTSTGACDLLVVEDDGFYEIFADGGTVMFSVNTY